MSVYAIHALFTFYLAGFGRYEDTTENLDFRVLPTTSYSELVCFTIFTSNLKTARLFYYFLIFILSSLSTILCGRVWVLLGMPDLSTFYLALSGHTTGLSGLPLLCLG